MLLNWKTSHTSSLGSGPRHTSNNLGHAALYHTEIARSLFLGKQNRELGGKHARVGGGQGPEFLCLHGQKVLEGLSIYVPKTLWKNYFPTSLPTEKRNIGSQKSWNMGQGSEIKQENFRLASKGNIVEAEPLGSEQGPMGKGLRTPSTKLLEHIR